MFYDPFYLTITLYDIWPKQPRSLVVHIPPHTTNNDMYVSMWRLDHACCLGHVDHVLVDGIVCAGIGYLRAVSLFVGLTHTQTFTTHAVLFLFVRTG